MELKFKVQTRIQKPVAEVFDAVQNPDKLRGYFTNGGASGPLTEGSSVIWRFADNPGDEAVGIPVKVIQVIQDELIVLEWEGAKGLDTRVEMNFEPIGDGDTLVKIAETGWRETQDNLNSSYMNCFGWGHMLTCLKAYIEYGIDLRKGAFGGVYSASNQHGTDEEG